MKKIIALACSFIFLFALSCKNRSDKSAEDIIKEVAQNPNVNVSTASYSVDAPTGWRETDTSINGLKAHFLFSPNTDNKINANLNIMNENMQGTDIDVYSKANIANMTNALQSFKVIEQGDTKTTAGNNIRWYHTTYTINNYNIEAIEYIIPIDKIAYILTGTTQQGYFDKYKDDFDKIAKSFKLK